MFPSVRIIKIGSVITVLGEERGITRIAHHLPQLFSVDAFEGLEVFFLLLASSVTPARARHAPF